MTAAAELQAILGCTPADAERALAETKGDLERAMNWLLDAPVTPAESELPAYSDAVRESQPAPPALPAPAPAPADEDDQLMRVLAESVQTSAPKAGARTDLVRLRVPGAPLALVASAPVYAPLALFLQALVSTPRACDAFLRLPRSSVPSLEGYWAGAVLPSDARDDTRLAERVQTLCAFAQESVRAAAITGDADTALPRTIVLAASRGAPLHELLESTSPRGTLTGSLYRRHRPCVPACE